MSVNTSDMTDAELDAAIYDNPSIHENGEDTGPVSPTIEEPTEQLDDQDVDPDNQDSDGDSADEEQTEDSDPETPDESDEEETDDTEDGEDKTTESEDEPELEKTTKLQPLKANGKEYPIDDISELYKLASAGVGAQQKFQAIAKHKKTIMAAEKADVDLMEAVNFSANYKEDPKGTLMRLLKEQNIDPYELDLDDVSSEKGKDHSVSDFEVKYSDIVGEIGDSPKFQDVQKLLLEDWDEASRDVFFAKPEMIKQLHDEMLPMEGDTKSMYDLVSPIAEKMKLSGDTRSDFDIYMDARNRKQQEFEKFNSAKKSVGSKSKTNNKSQKKKASPTTGKSTGKKSIDISKLSDDELDAFIAKLG